jgi:hypothetical protein
MPGQIDRQSDMQVEDYKLGLRLEMQINCCKPGMSSMDLQRESTSDGELLF